MTDLNEERRLRIVACFHLAVLGARRCLHVYEKPDDPRSRIECPNPAMYRCKLGDNQSEFFCSWCLTLYGSSNPDGDEVYRAHHAPAIAGLAAALEEPASMLRNNIVDVIEDARLFLMALPPCRGEDADCARCVWVPDTAGRLALYELTKALSFEKPFSDWPTNPVEEMGQILTIRTAN